MACSCHGKQGIATRKTNPYDQCTTCAKKHIVKAWNLFNEFTYTDDNRDAISGQLRNAADHLKDDHRETALYVRDLAVLIEENRDKEIGDMWDKILTEVREYYYIDHPDAARRLLQLRGELSDSGDSSSAETKNDKLIDYIIPLGTESKFNNDELRILLRSLERNAIGLGTIYIVATQPPSWLQNVTIIKMGDPLPHNKDGNIINKVLKAASLPVISSEFVWSADDNVFMKPVVLSKLPPIYNTRNKEKFANQDSIWRRRVYRTFEFLEKRGVILEHNYESHTPQRFDTKKLLEAMKGIDYESDIGYTIDTLFFGLLGVTDGEPQADWKCTIERTAEIDLTKPFLGYNDGGFASGLREKLFKIFDKPSKYEK